MAAHDDKISNNRRKLFKALSAAPVVMTLRPGAALANASAYQCLAKPATLDFIPASSAEVCTGENDCFAYQLLTYWDVPSSTSCSGQAIVEVNGAFYTLGGDLVSTVTKDGDNKLSGTLGACVFVGLPPNDGYFLVLVEPVDAAGNGVTGDSGNAVDINPAGVYPETQYAGTNLQGITQTCLCSIHPDATGTFVRLSTG